MSGEPASVSEMADEEFADFVSEMYTLVVEGAYLWEFPAGTRDVRGKTLTEHGPWRIEDCGAALRLWFDDGLLSLLRRWPHEHPVPVDEVAGMLASRDHWDEQQNASMSVAVMPTEAGDALSGRAWEERVRALRDPCRS